MKLYFCVFLVIATSQVVVGNSLNQWIMECKNQTDVTHELYQKFFNRENVNDDRLKQYAFCMGKKSGIMNENGDINVDTMKYQLEQNFGKNEEIDNIVNHCTVKRDTPIQTAYALFVCFRDNRPKSFQVQ